MDPMQPLIKKLLRFYLLAVVIVLLYFLIKTLMPEENTLPSKSFPSVNKNQSIISEEKKELENGADESKRTFILLPQK